MASDAGSRSAPPSIFMHNETPNDIAQAHAIYKMHLQAIGTLVTRQLVKDNAINIQKLEDACMDLRLVDVDDAGKFIDVPIIRKQLNAIESQL